MNRKIIDNLSIVLVATTHPGNIGATARAMKTMGLERLKLVTPKIFPGAEVTARAAGADDILATAEVYESLQQAVGNCHLVFGTSARLRSFSWPVLAPDIAAAQVIDKAAEGDKVAVVFGRESSGLTNEELECCNAMLHIPTNPAFSSLNVASAVQIVCYEIYKLLEQANEQNDRNDDQSGPVSVEQMEKFYEHLEQCSIDIGYLDPEKPRHFMRKMKCLFNRAQLDLNEYQILRGILAAAREKANK